MNWRPECVVGAEVEHLHDVRVHEPRGGERLAAEARDEARVLGQVLGQQLDGDVALQPRVERELDGGHAADAEPAFEPVAVGEELLGGHQRRPPASRSARRAPRSGARRLGRGRGGRGGAVGASVGVGVGGVGRRRGLGRRLRGLASASRSPSAVGVGGRLVAGSRSPIRLLDPVDPVLQVLLQLAVDRARQRVDLALGRCGSAAAPRCGPRPCRRSGSCPPSPAARLALHWGISSGFDCPQPASDGDDQDEERREASHRRSQAAYCPYWSRSASESGRRAARIAAWAPAMSYSERW